MVGNGAATCRPVPFLSRSIFVPRAGRSTASSCSGRTTRSALGTSSRSCCLTSGRVLGRDFVRAVTVVAVWQSRGVVSTCRLHDSFDPLVGRAGFVARVASNTRDASAIDGIDARNACLFAHHRRVRRAPHARSLDARSAGYQRGRRVAGAPRSALAFSPASAGPPTRPYPGSPAGIFTPRGGIRLGGNFSASPFLSNRIFLGEN
jgi:hypothetical protein